MEIMLQIHHWVAYILLLLLIVSVVKFVMGAAQKSAFSGLDNKLSLFTLIFMHTQVLIGLGVYFSSGPYQALKANAADAMATPVIRMMAVEHPLVGIIAAVLITMGRSRAKKRTEDAAKFRQHLIFFGIGTLLVLSRVPWERLFN